MLAVTSVAPSGSEGERRDGPAMVHGLAASEPGSRVPEPGGLVFAGGRQGLAIVRVRQRLDRTAVHEAAGTAARPRRGPRTGRCRRRCRWRPIARSGSMPPRARAPDVRGNLAAGCNDRLQAAMLVRMACSNGSPCPLVPVRLRASQSSPVRRSLCSSRLSPRSSVRRVVSRRNASRWRSASSLRTSATCAELDRLAAAVLGALASAVDHERRRDRHQGDGDRGPARSRGETCDAAAPSGRAGGPVIRARPRRARRPASSRCRRPAPRPSDSGSRDARPSPSCRSPRAWPARRASTRAADGISPRATRRKISPTSWMSASGGMARQDAVKRRTEAVYVARRSHPVQLAHRLLGAHVLRSAQSRAVQGRLHAAAGRRPECPLILDRGRTFSRPLDRLGQSPVDHQGFAEFAQHHVRRLQVAVEHAPAMGVGHHVANALEMVEQLAKFQRLTADRSRRRETCESSP